VSKSRPYLAFGELLTEAIKQLALQATMRMVQEDLAERLGYSSSAIYAWRRGEHLPEPQVIAELARLFVQEWQADQQWINDFLEKAQYGPPSAVAALNEELFGQKRTPDEAGFRSQTQADFEKAAAGGIELEQTVRDSLTRRRIGLISALTNWSNAFFRWSEASNHVRSSWAGMLLYTMSVLMEKITPRRALMFLLALALWMATAWLMAPVLQWPLDDANMRWVAFLQYGIATLVIPLLVAVVTQPDQYDDFHLNSVKQKATLWFLKLTGALVGFYTFSLTVIGLVLIWYYLHRPPLPTEGVVIVAVIPLFMSYVAARRIPADRYKMFQGELRLHEADPLFFGVFIVTGPLTALFIYLFYQFLSDRTVAPMILIISLIGLTWLEYRKRARG
jgi:transcriptional regulator with XRE-family HTH domain